MNFSASPEQPTPVFDWWGKQPCHCSEPLLQLHDDLFSLAFLLMLLSVLRSPALCLPLPGLVEPSHLSQPCYHCHSSRKVFRRARESHYPSLCQEELEYRGQQTGIAFCPDWFTWICLAAPLCHWIPASSWELGEGQGEREKQEKEAAARLALKKKNGEKLLQASWLVWAVVSAPVARSRAIHSWWAACLYSAVQF